MVPYHEGNDQLKSKQPSLSAGSERKASNNAVEEYFCRLVSSKQRRKAFKRCNLRNLAIVSAGWRQRGTEAVGG